MQCPKCSTSLAEGVSCCDACGACIDVSALTTLSEPLHSPYRARLWFPPGTLFAGRYTIVEKTGEGGMGVVYKAIDGALHSEVALKLIKPELALVPALVDRFRNEVRLT